MPKQSTITNLLVIPLIASAVFLSSGGAALANTSTNSPNTEIRSKTHKSGSINTRKGIAGTVTSVNGTLIVVTDKGGVKYTVDASHATIMKASTGSDTNPAIITSGDIQVGDAIMVRGTINDTEINANKIFDGKMPHKHLKKIKHQLHKKLAQ